MEFVGTEFVNVGGRQESNASPPIVERDRGTGLGLATVFGIVNQLDGAIDLQSQEGFGTMMTVDFPGSVSLAAGK